MGKSALSKHNIDAEDQPNAASDDEDSYSDEEIADDSGEGDDGTNNLDQEEDVTSPRIKI